jgi:FAD synthetase
MKARFEKKILASLYLDSIRYSMNPPPDDKRGSSFEKLSEEAGIEENFLREIIKQMQADGLLSQSNSDLELTHAGRSKITVVMAGGTFDIIHCGHIETLEAAKSLGDVLVVSVARNKTVQKTRGRPPVNDEKLRQKLVSSVRFVDAALLGSEVDILETVELVKPDIIALGYDQHHTESSMMKGLEARGLRARIVRLGSNNPEIKTSSLLGSSNRADLLKDT